MAEDYEPQTWTEGEEVTEEPDFEPDPENEAGIEDGPEPTEDFTDPDWEDES